MKYCPVIPPTLVKYAPALVERLQTGLFCYADIAYHDEQYAQHFKDVKYIVLDCPIMEKGEIITPKQLRRTVDKIKPIFTIIPDVVFDRKATMRMFIRYLDAVAHDSCTGVLQGSTAQELVECAVEMFDAGVSRLAIPRISSKNGGVARSEIIRRVTDERGPTEWHLLGANWPYTDEILCSKLGLASSVDTAEPVNAALRDSVITKRSVRRPSDFLQRKHISRRHLYENVKEMQTCLNVTQEASQGDSSY